MRRQAAGMMRKPFRSRRDNAAGSAAVALIDLVHEIVSRNTRRVWVASQSSRRDCIDLVFELLHRV